MLSIAQSSQIQASWCKETCYPDDREEWSIQNPALGQCVVTALLVQELL